MIIMIIIIIIIIIITILIILIVVALFSVKKQRVLPLFIRGKLGTSKIDYAEKT